MSMTTPQSGNGASPAGDPMIQFHDVDKAWGDNHVLRSLNFDVAPTEKVTIIGPSGSGKTTILRVLMTLEFPNSGVVTVDNRTLWDIQRRTTKPPKLSKEGKETRKEIGMVFQSFNLFPHMTAQQNVMEAPQKVLGLSKEEAEQRAVELLGMVGLDKHLLHRPGQLSGGQQQRVAIARAMAMRPKVVLFDEPTSALDPELVGDVLEVIRELARTTDMTMLMVTHEMSFAEEISDRVVMFDKGAVVEQGPPQQIFHEPTEDRTRQFLHAVLER